ncbi:MAG: right-handed parallel beta-helix repeat-containing protein [Promethearchaeota archaeon]
MKMKTKASLLIGIFALAMVFGIFTMVIAPIRADPGTFIVSPSGGDDTGAIQQAFEDAKAAGPGSTVQLTAGQFYTNATFVENFYGTFKGAGKDLTTIDVLKGIYPEEGGVVGPYGNHLFTFEGGDICISDLGFEITPEKPAGLSYDGTYDLFTILITGEINSRIERVKLTGHEGDQSGYPVGHPLSEKTYNVRLGVEYMACLNGKHTFTKCEFDSLWLGITVWMVMNCELTITSNSIKGGAIGIINAINDNSKFEISSNYIETTYFGGIWAIQDLPVESASQWLITHNTIKVLSSDSDGIFLADFLSFKSLEAVVSNNEITLDDANWGGIWTFGLEDAFIYRNVIRGAGLYGIGCVFISDSLILSNKISNSENNGMNFFQASNNLILGNYIRNNGGWGLFMAGSNDNCIAVNLFYNNALGNIYDDGINKYKWNIQF